MVIARSAPKKSNPRTAVTPITNAGLILSSTMFRRRSKAANVAALPTIMIVVTWFTLELMIWYNPLGILG